MAKSKRFVGDKIIGIIGLLVVVGALSYIAILRPPMIRQEKERFLEAQAGLEQLYDQIVAKVGEPDEVKREQSCSRPNLKLEQGPLSCDVGIELWHKNKNVDQANAMMNTLKALYNYPLRIGSGAAKGSSFYVRQSPAVQTFFQSLEKIADLSCAVGYSYPVVPGLYQDFTSEYSENFKLHLSCGGSAKAEHFPLKN